MKPRRGDPIVATILGQSAYMTTLLHRQRIPAWAMEDVRQDILLRTWQAARRGALAWRSPKALRVFLRVVAHRAAWQWRRDNPKRDELVDHVAPVALTAEHLFLALETLLVLRASTTPERWGALLAYAIGIPAHVVAAREGVPTSTVYTWIRLAREDIRAALAREAAAAYVRRRR